MSDVDAKSEWTLKMSTAYFNARLLKKQSIVVLAFTIALLITWFFVTTLRVENQQEASTGYRSCGKKECASDGSVMPVPNFYHARSFSLTLNCDTLREDSHRKNCLRMKDEPDIYLSSVKRNNDDNLDLSFWGIESFHGLRSLLRDREISKISLRGNCLFCTKRNRAHAHKAFRNLNDVKSLDVRGNVRTSRFVHNGRVFSYLPSLEQLQLDGPTDPAFGAPYRRLRALKLLSFEGGLCKMVRVRGHAFVGFAKSPIIELDLSSCNIEYIESKKVFHSFPKLELLRISNNRFADFDSAFFSSIKGLGSLASIKHLVADNVVSTRPDVIRCSDYRSSIDGALLSLLIGLESVSLKHDCIEVIDGYQFREKYKSVAKLVQMDVSYNSISLLNIKNAIFFEKLPHIKVINLEHQRYFDPTLGEEISKQPMLNLGRFSLRKLLGNRPIPWNISANLEELHLSGAVDAQNLNVDFVLPENNQLRTVSFTHNSVIDPQFCVYGLYKLDHLDVSNNGLQSLPYCFQDILPSMKYVNMSRNNLGEFTARGDYKPQQPKIELWDFSNNNLYRMAPDMFMNTSLNTILLSHNRLTERNEKNSSIFDMLPFTPKLARVDLSFNRFTHMDAREIELVKRHPSEIKINLYGNPFDCDSCAALKFLWWFKEDQTSGNPRLDLGEQYTCADPRHQGQTLHQVNLLYLRAVCVPLLIYTLVIFLCMSAILVKIVLKLSGRAFVPFVANTLKVYTKRRVKYKYDVYLVYHDADLKWALHFRNILEDLRLTCCMRDREFPLGDSFSDTVIESIKQSKKTVCVLSEAFLKDADGWRSWETEMVHHEQVQQQRHFLLFVSLSSSLELSSRPLLQRLVAVEPILSVDHEELDDKRLDSLLSFLRGNL